MTHTFFARLQADTINVCRLVRRHPSTLLYPLLVLTALVGLGVWGVTRVAHSDVQGAKDRATAIAIEAASSYRQRLTLATAPIPSLVALVRHNANYSFLSDIFPSFVQDLVQQMPGDALRSLQLAPFGVVRLVYPLQGNQAAIGLDLFGAVSERDMALKTVANRSLTLAGPMLFRQGGYGIRVRMPIFVSTSDLNATFGGPDQLNPFCGAVCYDPVSQTKFWGFATALIDLDRLTASSAPLSPSSIISPLSPTPLAFSAPLAATPGSSSTSSSSSSSPLPPLASPTPSPSTISRADMNTTLDWLFHGYRYRLLAPGVAANLSVIARSSQPPKDPVRATIDLLNTQWLLELSPSNGSWEPSWYVPLLVTCIVVAVLVAIMLFAALVSRHQHQMLLEALLPRDVIREMVGRDTASMRPQIMQADTPADLLLKMMGCLLEGGRPELRDVLLIRTTVLRNLDIYTPLNLGNHIKGANLDADVTRALMRQLGGAPDHESLFDDTPEDALGQMRLGGEDADCGLDDGEDGGDGDGPPAMAHDCDTLTGALALILTPQPAVWYDTCNGGAGGGGADVNDAASDAALPTVGTECSLLSPAPSLAAVSLGLGGIGGTAGAAAATPPGLPASPAAAAMGSRQLSLNVPGRGVSGSGSGAMGISESGVFTRASRDFAAGSHGVVRSSASGLLPLGGGTGNGVSYMPTSPPRAATQPGCLPSATTAAAVINAAAAAAAAAAATIEEALDSGCLSESTAATAAAGYGNNVSQHGGVGPQAGGGGPGGGGGATAAAAAVGSASSSSLLQLPPPPPPGLPLQVLSACNGSLQPQWSGTLRHGIAAPPPRSPLGAQRHKRLGQAAGQPPNHGSLQTTGAVYSGGFANGALCLSATFSGNLSTGQLATPEERPSSRFGCAGGGGGCHQGVASGNALLQTLNARRLSQPPPPSVIDEVERLLAQADSWQFNTWELRDASQGHPLSCLGFHLIQRSGLIGRFKINPVTLARLLRHIEAGYPDNPYHSATHAADVLQTLHVIVHGAQLHVHYLDGLGLLAAYFAAIVHDYGHPGVTNDFLIATSDPLAVRYNDRSPLENHHAAAAFSVLRRPELDVTAALTPSDRTAFRKQVIDLVLATDMKQHFAVLSHFNTVHRLASFSHATPGTNAAAAPSTTHGAATPLTHRSSRNLHIDLERLAASEMAPKPRDETERLLGLQVAIKAADLGHLGEELEVHQRWLGVLEEEFFRQGDRERDLGLPISPLFDRAKQGVSKSQVGFYDFVALPLVHALSSAFPGTQPLMRCFISNYNHWRTVDGQPPVSHQASRKQPHPQQQAIDPRQPSVSGAAALACKGGGSTAGPLATEANS